MRIRFKKSSFAYKKGNIYINVRTIMKIDESKRFE